jgi:hypothetical protein
MEVDNDQPSERFGTFGFATSEDVELTAYSKKVTEKLRDRKMLN